MNLILLLSASTFGILAARGFCYGLRREANTRPNGTEWLVSGMVGVFVTAMIFALLHT